MDRSSYHGLKHSPAFGLQRYRVYNLLDIKKLVLCRILCWPINYLRNYEFHVFADQLATYFLRTRPPNSYPFSTSIDSFQLLYACPFLFLPNIYMRIRYLCLYATLFLLNATYTYYKISNSPFHKFKPSSIIKLQLDEK